MWRRARDDKGAVIARAEGPKQSHLNPKPWRTPWTCSSTLVTTRIAIVAALGFVSHSAPPAASIAEKSTTLPRLNLPVVARLMTACSISRVTNKIPKATNSRVFDTKGRIHPTVSTATPSNTSASSRPCGNLVLIPRNRASSSARIPIKRNPAATAAAAVVVSLSHSTRTMTSIPVMSTASRLTALSMRTSLCGPTQTLPRNKAEIAAPRLAQVIQMRRVPPSILRGDLCGDLRRRHERMQRQRGDRIAPRPIQRRGDRRALIGLDPQHEVAHRCRQRTHPPWARTARAEGEGDLDSICAVEVCNGAAVRGIDDQLSSVRCAHRLDHVERRAGVAALDMSAHHRQVPALAGLRRHV